VEDRQDFRKSAGKDYQTGVKNKEARIAARTLPSTGPKRKGGSKLGRGEKSYGVPSFSDTIRGGGPRIGAVEDLHAEGRIFGQKQLREAASARGWRRGHSRTTNKQKKKKKKKNRNVLTIKFPFFTISPTITWKEIESGRNRSIVQEWLKAGRKPCSVTGAPYKRGRRSSYRPKEEHSRSAEKGKETRKAMLPGSFWG